MKTLLAMVMAVLTFSVSCLGTSMESRPLLYHFLPSLGYRGAVGCHVRRQHHG